MKKLEDYIRRSKKKLDRTTFYVDKDMVKRLKAKLILEGGTISNWLRQKMREELGEY